MIGAAGRHVRCGVTLLALCAGAGCGEGPAPGVPAAGSRGGFVPPPPPPPPPGPRLVIGFDRERVELTEGEDGEILVGFALELRGAADEGLSSEAARFVDRGFDLRVEVEDGTAGAGDLQVAGGVTIRAPLGLPLRESAWLAMHAPADGVVEDVEVLKLRLAAPDLELPPESELEVVLAPAEAEVVIRDGSVSCEGVSISASRPVSPAVRPIGSRPARRTDIVIRADASQPVGLDVLTGGTTGFTEWRVFAGGAWVEHRIRMGWILEPEDGCELRLQPCAAGDRGPVLVCTPHSCLTYGPGEAVPPVRPVGPRVCKGYDRAQ